MSLLAKVVTGVAGSIMRVKYGMLLVNAHETGYARTEIVKRELQNVKHLKKEKKEELTKV